MSVQKLQVGLFATSYLPSIEYVTLLSKCYRFSIDENDVWKRQSLRNRTFILSPNGVQMLTVPVCHPTTDKILTKDIKISYDLPWIRTHKGALEAAYNTSAFFDFFKDDLWAIFDKHPTHLVELNHEILKLLLSRFKLANKLSKIPPTENEELKTLNAICNSSNNVPVLLDKTHFKSYPQVFSYKFDFMINLSSLDLLSNKGVI
jgi:hypothetical protein